MYLMHEMNEMQLNDDILGLNWETSARKRRVGYNGAIDIVGGSRSVPVSVGGIGTVCVPELLITPGDAWLSTYRHRPIPVDLSMCSTE
jgi:hypothetical protein